MKYLTRSYPLNHMLNNKSDFYIYNADAVILKVQTRDLRGSLQLKISNLLLFLHSKERLNICFQEYVHLCSCTFCYVQLLSHQNHRLTYQSQNLTLNHTTHLTGLSKVVWCNKPVLLMTQCTIKLPGVKFCRKPWTQKDK